MKIREAVRKLKRSGWIRVRQGATSHALWKRGQQTLLLTEHDPMNSAAIAEVRRAIQDR